MLRKLNLLLQLDGKLPNLALMRLSAHLKRDGQLVEFRKVSSPLSLERGLFDANWTAVYASLIFERTRPLAERLKVILPDAIIGGTGWDRRSRLEDLGVNGSELDYSLYPGYSASIGFTQRGCRLQCPFCVVPEKEGRIAQERPIREIWRDEPYPRHLLLLDNDFFGAPGWRERCRLTELLTIVDAESDKSRRRTWQDPTDKTPLAVHAKRPRSQWGLAPSSRPMPRLSELGVQHDLF
jgi:hypothetical protein